MVGAGPLPARPPLLASRGKSLRLLVLSVFPASPKGNNRIFIRMRCATYGAYCKHSFSRDPKSRRDEALAPVFWVFHQKALVLHLCSLVLVGYAYFQPPSPALPWAPAAPAAPSHPSQQNPSGVCNPEPFGGGTNTPRHPSGSESPCGRKMGNSGSSQTGKVRKGEKMPRFAEEET